MALRVSDVDFELMLIFDTIRIGAILSLLFGFLLSKLEFFGLIGSAAVVCGGCINQ